MKMAVVITFRDRSQLSFSQMCNGTHIKICSKKTSKQFSCVLLCHTSWFAVNRKKTLIGKTSRRFKELDAEILHRCSMGHYATLNGVGFVYFFFTFSPFFGGPRYLGTSALHSDPAKSKIKQKTKKSTPDDFA